MAKNLLPALAVAVFPIVLAIGIVTIPVVADYANHDLAVAMAAQSGRWFWGHAISAVGFGLSLFAAATIRRYLPNKSRLVEISFVLLCLGAAAFAFGLGADGIGPLAAAQGPGGALAYFEHSGGWIGPVFISGSVIFGTGLILQTIAVNNAGLLKGVWQAAAFVGAIVFTGATAIPSGWGLYAVATGCLLAVLPVSAAILKR